MNLLPKDSYFWFVKTKKHRLIAIGLNFIYFIALLASCSFTFSADELFDSDNESNITLEKFREEFLSTKFFKQQLSVKNETKHLEGNYKFNELSFWECNNEWRYLPITKDNYLMLTKALMLSENKFKLLFPFHFFL